jgi:DNA-binding beta-propeller fold protein YncE
MKASHRPLLALKIAACVGCLCGVGIGQLSANQSPLIKDFSASAYPAAVGAAVVLSATATDADGDALEYKFEFGDGEVSTFSNAPSRTHTYAEPGHYAARVQVRDNGGGFAMELRTVTVLDRPAQQAGISSSPIICDAQRRRVWVVNPDNDTVTAIHPDALSKEFEVPVSTDPRSLARSADGTIWVVSYDADRIDILHGQDGSLVMQIAFAYGSLPSSIVFSPDGRTGYVALEGKGEVIRVDAVTGQTTGRVHLGPFPRAMALSADGSRLFVSRLISPDQQGEIWDVATAGTMRLTRTIPLAFDPGPDSDNSGRGVPNYLTGIAITPSPKGYRAWVVSKKDNIGRGVVRDGYDLTFENTVRTILSSIDVPP